MPENIIFMELYKKQFYKISLQNIHRRRNWRYRRQSAVDCFYNRSRDTCHATVCGEGKNISLSKPGRFLRVKPQIGAVRGNDLSMTTCRSSFSESILVYLVYLG